VRNAVDKQIRNGCTLSRRASSRSHVDLTYLLDIMNDAHRSHAITREGTRTSSSLHIHLLIHITALFKPIFKLNLQTMLSFHYVIFI